MEEINIVEILKAAKTDFTIEATMSCRNKTVLTKLRINTIEKTVTVEDINCTNPKDVFVIIRGNEQLLSLEKIKFFKTV
ncbi:TPA: hypothetical protein DIC40_03710 [Patescibacteria group bacterium]|nr:hypothetical protein P148_SR1C00001G0455 [candidate division SR1 bacterium RAAC1_SR1_1]HCY20947.1 hypothetical protein [Candidatus Gracilibacteria bacterium]